MEQKTNKKPKQEAHRSRLAHLSDTATADMQMLCNIYEKADHHNFSYSELSLPKQYLYKISHTASVILEEMSFIKKKSFFKI